jgi:tetratricopeptide (TPR) repeat protein
MGLLYDKIEAYDNAELAFKTVLKIDPNFSQKGDILFKLGLFHSTKSQYDEAILVNDL